MFGAIGNVSDYGVAQSRGEHKKSHQTDGFSAMMEQLKQTQNTQVAFSKHAMNRVEERGIEVTDALLRRLGESVERAQVKGATNILALDQNQAFIVNVPNYRVITALSETELKESVFTNIDGAVFL